MIKYLGSKRTLLSEIMSTVQSLTPAGTVLDLFSGTSRVSQALRSRGYQVFANDHNAYVEGDMARHGAHAQTLIAELNRLPGEPGYFTNTFCERSRFFQPRNGARVDAIREEIARKGLDPVLEAVLLTSLLEAADRVDSTVGVQMAYLKQWSPRSFNSLVLLMPDLPKGVRAGRATQLDAYAAAPIEADVAYLDPPYNQHKYLGNYHIWESLVLWDKPEVYGIACKRVDCRTRKSEFNSKLASRAALVAVIDRIVAPHIIVSFNDEGFITREEMLGILRPLDVRILEFPRKRYIGAKIGVYSPQGEKVGEAGRTDNIEYLFVATKAR